MKQKPRPESLYARLKTRENRYLVFSWIYEEGATYVEVVKRIKEHFGVQTSKPALSGILKSHGAKWRVEDSVGRADAQKVLLPEEYDQKRKDALAQREFEAVMRELSFKDVMLAQRLELDREKVKMQRELQPHKVALARRNVQFIETRLSAAQNTEEDATLTPAQKQERLRQIFGLI